MSKARSRRSNSTNSLPSGSFDFVIGESVVREFGDASGSSEKADADVNGHFDKRLVGNTVEMRSFWGYHTAQFKNRAASLANIPEATVRHDASRNHLVEIEFPKGEATSGTSNDAVSRKRERTVFQGSLVDTPNDYLLVIEDTVDDLGRPTKRVRLEALAGVCRGLRNVHESQAKLKNERARRPTLETRPHPTRKSSLRASQQGTQGSNNSSSTTSINNTTSARMPTRRAAQTKRRTRLSAVSNASVATSNTRTRTPTTTTSAANSSDSTSTTRSNTAIVNGAVTSGVVGGGRSTLRRSSRNSVSASEERSSTGVALADDSLNDTFDDFDDLDSYTF